MPINANALLCKDCTQKDIGEILNVKNKRMMLMA